MTNAELLQEVDRLRKRVAELKQTQEALRESENKWRSLLNNTPDIVMIVDRNGTIRFINHTVPGIKEQEAAGKRVYDYISPGHHDTVRKDLEQVFQTGQSSSQEISGVGPHGSLSWYQAQLGPIKQDERIVAASIVTRDITEHKRADQNLNAAKEHAELIYRVVPSAIFAIDKNRCITNWNNKAVEITGYAAEEVLGKECTMFALSPCCDRCGLYSHDVEKPIVAKECTIKTKSGKILTILKNADFLKDVNGNIIGGIESFEDITERKNTEQSLRESEERLRVALSAAQMGTWRWDPATNQDTRDASFNGILGLEAVESTQPVDDFLQRVHPEDRDMVDAEIQRTLREHRTYVAEFRIVRPDGTVRWLRDQGKLLYDENDHILYLTGAVVDITERKRAEDALKKSEEKYRLLFESTGTDNNVISVNGVYLMMNEKGAERLGGRPEHFVGKSVYDTFPKDAADEYVKRFRHVAESGEIKTYEDLVELPIGNRWFLTNMRPIKDPDGNITSVQLISQDITERKRAEDALRESEKKYKALFQGAAEGIIVADAETKEFKYANPAICKMLDYTEEELERLCVRDIHPKEDLQHIISEFEKQAQREQTLTSNIPCLRKDGTIIYVDVNTAMVLIDGIQCNVGFFTDVSEHKRAEEALRESENKHRTLLENLPQKIFFKDRNSVYISCNDNFAGDFKIKSEEIAGKTDYDFFPKELAEKYRADDKRVMESGEAKDIEEKYIQQGQEVVVHTVKTPVKDTQGNVIGILGIFWDITEHKKAGEELNEYREKMAKAERLASLGTLSATLAHELNQPLTAIRLSIENSLAELETTSSPDIVIEDLKDGLSAVLDVASKVDSLRHFAQKSSKEIINEVNLKAVAERILNLLNESARRARVSLHLKGMDKLPLIQSNEKDLEQLFFALVENAIQAADRKRERRLIISGDVKDEHIELRFSDTCGGIAPENLDRIFEPFFTTRPVGERTGLGLCIVERIVSGAGGKIRVESKAGKGTTFYITLPINKDRLS